MEWDELLARVAALRAASETPIVVGISGYCGSGKSTLARQLVAALPGAVRMRGDDFLEPVRSHLRSSDWDGVERQRLVAEVLVPLRSEIPGQFRRFDWANRVLGPYEPLPVTDLLVVDLIGLLHPDALPVLDLTVWCDVDLATSLARGMQRDADHGRDHTGLWNDVWVPNERDFEERFSPKQQADVLYAAPSR